MATDISAPAGHAPAVNGVRPSPKTASFAALTIGSIGVVYGDIGTSPLYAFREALVAAAGHARSRDVLHGDWRAVADPVGADRHRHAEVRLHSAARRQQGRGRYARTDGAGAARTWRQPGGDRVARDRRRRLVLWRRDPDAGALGAVGGGRTEDRNGRLRALRRSAHGPRPRGAVCRAVARNRSRCSVLWTDHAVMVRCDSVRRPSAYRARA